MRDTARAWAASGAMALTGWPGEEPLAVAGHVVTRISGLAGRLGVDWGEALSGRAAMLGLRRAGRVSANGTCRILRGPDGWVALSMPRDDDIEQVEALTGTAPGARPWDVVADTALSLPAAEFTGRARLLGMAAAVLADPPPPRPPWTAERRWAPAPESISTSGLLVVDLSALWAGPLAARILAAGGAEVVKVESVARSDPSREVATFYEWLHPPNQEVVSLDLGSVAGRRRLRDVLSEAGVVIEASRPRALEQLDAAPGSLPPRPGRVWLSITGHGRRPPEGAWVGFGDDCAVAGGLVAWDDRDEPVFVADAVADPLSGMLGADAVLGALRSGGGQLIELAMADACAWVASPGTRAGAVAFGGEVAGPRWPAPIGAGRVAR